MRFLPSSLFIIRHKPLVLLEESGSQCSFETLGVAGPLMQHHIPEDHCENLKIYM